MVTYAPGESAFNIVERKMVPLSREMYGLILSHDSFGSHLNSKGEQCMTNLSYRTSKRQL